MWSELSGAVFYWKQLTLSNMEIFIHYFLSLSPASISSLCVYPGPKTSLSDESLQTSQLYILSQMCFITSSLPSNGCVKIPCNCLPFWEGETEFLLGSTCSIKQCCRFKTLWRTRCTILFQTEFVVQTLCLDAGLHQLFVDVCLWQRHVHASCSPSCVNVFAAVVCAFTSDFAQCTLFLYSTV